MEQSQKSKLSKAVLDMKFMKKTKERVENEEDAAEGHAMYSSEITEEMRKSGNINFIETSIVNCKQLIDGRLSFGGMNPHIQTLMAQSDYYKKQLELDLKKEQDVGDEEMAKNFSSLSKTMSKKFTPKRDKGRKFLKPADD